MRVIATKPDDLSFTQDLHSGRRVPALEACPLTPTCSVVYTVFHSLSFLPSLKEVQR